MRTTILACILAFGLLAVPTAVLANDRIDDHAHERAAANAHRGEGKGEERRNASANDTDDHGNKSKERPARANHTERMAAFETLMERLKAIRASWHENATKVREECRAAEAPEHGRNASREDVRAWAQCVREGYRELHQHMQAQRRAAWETFRASLAA